MSIDFAPTFYPSEKEFENFHDYVFKLEKEYSKDYGIVQIAPPKHWHARSGTDYIKSLDSLLLQGPIEQNAYGKGGIYELLLIQKKSLTLGEYKKKVSCFNDIVENKSVEEVEDLFWKNISFSPPLYGADIKGSIMDKGVAWNLSELDSVLSKGLPRVISGVNVPYLYIGSWKTMFGWHKEDLDLYSINFLHYGKSKFWYSMPESEATKFESFAKECFPDGFNKCNEFLRHKTVMINPYLLKKNIPDLKINKILHKPEHFIITFGGAYHSGFNWGFNIAEAVNFATPYWLETFSKAKVCSCLRDTVKIDKEEFLNNLLKSDMKSIPEIIKFGKKLKIDVKTQIPQIRSRSRSKSQGDKKQNKISRSKSASTSPIKERLVKTKIIHKIKTITTRTYYGYKQKDIPKKKNNKALRNEIDIDKKKGSRRK